MRSTAWIVALLVAVPPMLAAAPGSDAEPRQRAIERIAHEIGQLHASVWFLIALPGLVASAALLSGYLALTAPRATRRATQIRAMRPRLAFLVGVLNLLGGVIVCAIFNQNAGTRGVAALCGIGLFGLMFAGLHVAAAHVGRRVLDALDRPIEPFRTHTYGMAIVAVQSALPIAGWAYGAYQLASGAGSCVLALLTRDRSDGPPPTTELPTGHAADQGPHQSAH